MKKLKVTALPVNSDPTLPTRIIPTAKGDITLCTDIGVLMDSEAALIRAGHDVSLLLGLKPLQASAIRTFFVIAAHRFHPELGLEEAMALVDLNNLPLISRAISDLWIESMPKPKTDEHPQKPNQ